MRLLMLPRYGTLGASSRLRAMQYVPSLRKVAIHVDVSSLLDDSYIQDMYTGTLSVAAVVTAYLQRLRKVLSSRTHDIVWIEKEVWPWIPASLELAALSA